MILPHEEDVTDILPHLHHRGGVVDYHEADTWGPIRAIALTKGCAPVAAVHMRSSTWDRIYRESNRTLDPEALAREEGFGIVIDDTLPLFPGFEIHREVW